MKENVIIFDTTLRDGEQSPGASMTRDEKVRIAKVLEAMRVDVIEAGFPAASSGDLAAVRAVATAVTQSTVCALARAIPTDLDAAAQAIAPAKRGRIHTFIASSNIHMEKKLRMQPDDVLAAAVAAVTRARNSTDDVEFSPEDAGRSDRDFLCRLIEATIDAGATTINIPDTVGYSMPDEFGALVAYLIETIPNADKAIFSVHCHNDLGFAVANALSAVRHGARQIECTINGIGERAGNASLEEAVMAIRTRQDIFPCDTRIDTTHIVAASKLVSRVTGFPVQPNKAIVGANAFAHESGIHQDGVLKHRETYEIMRAEDVGWHANRLVLGKHSGRAALKERCAALEITFLNDDAFHDFFVRFKALADKKHDIFDDDLYALTEQAISLEKPVVCLVDYAFCIESGKVPHATVTLSIYGDKKTAESSGDGLVDAAFSAVQIAYPHDARLELYSVQNITEGTDAQGTVTVRLRQDGKVVNGTGSDTDIVTASLKAYIDGLNRLQHATQRGHPQNDVHGV